MKLILTQYLSSLKERNELDAILPDLLSQMGLHVFSKPNTGSKQYGVDVAAYGSLNDGKDSVYLFSVKSGNLTPSTWEGTDRNDLRPSLNSIIDVYINTHLPSEYEQKPIVICICIGGEIRQNVRQSVSQYEKSNRTDRIRFEEWDGDRLASLIDQYFLREDLLPPEARPLLRKSLALLDEPEVSFKHFSQLVKSLSAVNRKKRTLQVRAIRQLNISLWILFAWARDVGNLESAYLSAEITLLHGWEINRLIVGKKSKHASDIRDSYWSILRTYHLISDHFFKKILPYVDIDYGLSIAVNSRTSVDINLKLFDLLGRLSIHGIWHFWLSRLSEESEQEKIVNGIREISKAIIDLINSNPILFSPLKDENAIEVFLVSLLLGSDEENHQFITDWLSNIMFRATFSYKTHGQYPSIHRSYRKLIEHPKKNDEYRTEVTKASILYPTIALWAAILNDKDLFEQVRESYNDLFSHCNFQFWYPDEEAEDHIYINDEIFGANLSHLDLNHELEDFLDFVWSECRESDHFDNLSAVKYGMVPLVLVACRHYRLPVPIHFTLDYQNNSNS